MITNVYPNLVPFFEELNFTNKEAQFASRILGKTSPFLSSSEVVVEFLERIIVKNFDPTKYLVSNSATILVESIQEKIFGYKFNQAFEDAISDMSAPNFKVTLPFANTKSQSFKQLTATNLSELHEAILATLATQNLSRSEIAKFTGLRINSATPRVRELLNANLITVVGTKLDPESDRTVQLLGIKS